MEQWQAIRDLASLLAEVIRRAGAPYGSPDDWRAHITTAVKIMETANREVGRARD